MQAIALTDNNWAVSLKNKPLASIPAERKSMLEEIKGKTIIYDIAYVDKLPGQQPVAGCRNIVFLGDINDTVKGAECYSSAEEIKKAIENEESDSVYIISGAYLYDYFLKDINIFHITKIDYEYKADAYIDNLDNNPEFVLVADSDEQYCYDMIYSFLKYERK